MESHGIRHQCIVCNITSTPLSVPSPPSRTILCIWWEVHRWINTSGAKTNTWQVSECQHERVPDQHPMYVQHSTTTAQSTLHTCQLSNQRHLEHTHVHVCTVLTTNTIIHSHIFFLFHFYMYVHHHLPTLFTQCCSIYPASHRLHVCEMCIRTVLFRIVHLYSNKYVSIIYSI